MKFPGIRRKSHLTGGYNKTGIKILLVVMVLSLSCGLGAASGSSGGDHGSEEPAAKGWVNTDWFRVLNFTVLAVGLFLILRKPASQALNGRIESIKAELSELETQKKEAEKKLAEYNEMFSKLDKEAKGIMAEYIKQGEQAKTKILKAAESTAAKLEEQARKNIKNEFKRAKEALHAEILELALAKAEEIIKSKISSEDQDRLVDEYLEKVEA